MLENVMIAEFSQDQKNVRNALMDEEINQKYV